MGEHPPPVDETVAPASRPRGSLESETVISGGLSVADISAAMDELVRAKGWYAAESRRPQTPRNLATSLMLEAGELLECFQWGELAERDRVEDELADVVLYAVQLARVTGCDLAAAVLRKLEKNMLRTWDLPSEATG
jgi:NTP pyrophosphatase (non-canonical NTP hydrolase)